MSVVDKILKDLNFKPNEIDLYNKIRSEVFLKASDDEHGALVSRITKLIDEEYSE